MRPWHVFLLAVKELWSLARDPVLLGLIVFAFTISIHAATRALPETLNRASIAIVDEDRSPLSERIVAAFRPPYFATPRIVTIDEMDSRLDAGLDTFALDIPPDFQRDVLAGRMPAVQLNVDATRTSQAFNGSGYVREIVAREVAEFLVPYWGKAVAPVDLAMRVRFNPELNRSWFGAIMELIDHVTMLAIILTGAAVIRERERGTIEHLLVMPVTPLEVMTAKIASMGLVVLVTTAMSLVIVVQGLLNVPVTGSRGLFLAGTALHLFATTSLGMFLGMASRSMPQFGLAMILFLHPLQMLSGSMTPRESMPEWIRTIMLVAPNTHYVALAQGVLFRSAGLATVWPQFLALGAIGGILFGITLARFRKTMGTFG